MTLDENLLALYIMLFAIMFIFYLAASPSIKEPAHTN